MKERILYNWNISRVLYIVMGVILIIQSAIIQHWLGLAFGLYFAAMGIFAFGCAAGNCQIPPTTHSKEPLVEGDTN